MKRRNSRDIFFRNLRCRICNAVSHSDIAGDYGDHSQSAFYEEDDGLGFLCHECYVAMTSAIDDFSVDDDFDTEDPYDFEGDEDE